jgi:hypothetical protein
MISRNSLATKTSNQRQSTSTYRKTRRFRQWAHKFPSRLKWSTPETPYGCSYENIYGASQRNLFLHLHGTSGAHFQGGAFSILETLSVNLYLNGNVIGTSLVGETHDLPNQPSPVTLQSTLSLAAGDQVWMQIQSLTAGVTLYDDINHLTHFNGCLQEQDFS